MEESRERVGWWRSAAIYQVYIRSFADSNGDGVGDLIGIASRMPYLADLHIDALWVTSFYTSPMADGGYDVSDHRDVDSIFGRLSDVESLVQAAHAHGLRVIIDLVPNHTSSAHPWFAEALAAGPDSLARRRYHFRHGTGVNGEQPPNDWRSVFGGPAWTRIVERDGTPGQWYLHLFSPQQPDLNWEHPEVGAEFEGILRFWLDLGVDGFRIDVANAMAKAPGLPDMGGGPPAPGESVCWDRDDVHEIHRRWRRVLDFYPGHRIGVAEAWVADLGRLAQYVRPDELHQAFNFNYLRAEWGAPSFRQVIDASYAAFAAVGASVTWVLSNHDVQRHVTRYGDGETGRRRARAAALLTLALPGSIYLYQGEELGLPEVLDLPEEVRQDPFTERRRDGCRVPIPWSRERPTYGFGPPGSTECWLPQPETWAGMSVEEQLGDENSTLLLYRRALRLRGELPALGDGQLSWIDPRPGAERNLLILRREPGFVCTVNFGAEPASIFRPGRLLLASTDHADSGADSREHILPPETAAWWATGARAEG